MKEQAGNQTGEFQKLPEFVGGEKKKVKFFQFFPYISVVVQVVQVRGKYSLTTLKCNVK